jgi:hypothetical protein
MFPRYGLVGCASKWWLSRQHFEEDASEAVEIAAAVEMRFSPPLFRTLVMRGADNMALSRQTLIHGGGGSDDSKIGQIGMSGLQKDVCGFDVTMNQAMFVSMVEGIGYLTGDPDCQIEGEAPLLFQSFPNRLALYMGHHVIG